MSLLQELNKYYSALPKSEQVSLNNYLHETGKDLGSVMYSESEFKEFKKWQQASKRTKIVTQKIFKQRNIIKMRNQDTKEMNATIDHIKSVYPKDFKPNKVILLKQDNMDSNYNKKSGILFVNRKDTRRYHKLKDLVMKESGK